MNNRFVVAFDYTTSNRAGEAVVVDLEPVLPGGASRVIARGHISDLEPLAQKLNASEGLPA